MKIEVLEDEKDKLKIRVNDLTLVNALNENIWKQKVDYAAYKVEHPYLFQPELLVKSKNPKKSVLEAAEQIVSDAKEMRKQFGKALKE